MPMGFFNGRSGALHQEVLPSTSVEISSGGLVLATDATDKAQYVVCWPVWSLALAGGSSVAGGLDLRLVQVSDLRLAGRSSLLASLGL